MLTAPDAVDTDNTDTDNTDADNTQHSYQS